MVQGPSIFVGVDFGTTYSGIAWALEGCPDEIEVLSTWPGRSNRTSVKVPSIIAYTGEKNQNILWGYQLGQFQEAFRGIKLLLDVDQDSRYVPSLASKALLKDSKKDAVDVTADYLRQLLDLLKLNLERRFGMPTNEMNLRFIFTVPAVWSDKAKDATLQAAIKANARPEDVSLVSEPEAAALYALRSVQPNSINKGDVFVVCDAGGGTVDLISYEVKQLDPLILAEVAEGTGGICGSMMLDKRFEELLISRFGLHGYSNLSPKSIEHAVSYWQDRVKPNFVGKLDEDFADVGHFIPLPGVENNPDIPVEDGFLQLTRDDVEGIFEPIVQDIEALVSQQMKKVAEHDRSTKAIVLVGGFGASEYLFRRLQAANPRITILQPPNAWSAVVNGAVQRGLDGNRIESRIARRHYGFKCWIPFDQHLHSVKDRVWCPLMEEYRVLNHMSWHIKKSSEIRESQPIKLNFFRLVRHDSPQDLVFEDTLYFCNDEVAPEWMNPRIMKLCTLTSDLSRIPRGLFTTKRNSKGVKYYHISYALVLTPASASLLFELEFKDVSYGVVRTKY